MSGLATYYPVFKAIHVIFMVTWFAGLFYLPRLFIYHSEATDTTSRERFTIMQRRLFAIMTIGAVLTVVSGLLLVMLNQALWSITWFQLKLGLIVGLIVFHVRCYHWIGKLAAGHLPNGTRWLRWFNEIPAFFLITIVLLAVIKPF